jgi:hypothetical protein
MRDNCLSVIAILIIALELCFMIDQATKIQLHLSSIDRNLTLLEQKK